MISTQAERAQMITETELQALQSFAADHGDAWKDELLFCWMAEDVRGSVGNPDRGVTLHRLRNRLGPRWLAKFSL